jgi:hypothetical protein
MVWYSWKLRTTQVLQAARRRRYRLINIICIVTSATCINISATTASTALLDL